MLEVPKWQEGCHSHVLWSQDETEGPISATKYDNQGTQEDTRDDVPYDCEGDTGEDPVQWWRQCDQSSQQQCQGLSQNSG